MSGSVGDGIRLGLLLSGQHPRGTRPWRPCASTLSRSSSRASLASRRCGAASISLAPFYVLPERAAACAGGGGRRGDDRGDVGPSADLLNPVEVAENAATLDAIAGGRFVLGVGIGYRAVENAAFGVGQRRADLFERKLEVVRRLLSGESVTAEGDGFQLADARLTLVPDRLPPIQQGNQPNQEGTTEEDVLLHRPSYFPAAGRGIAVTVGQAGAGLKASRRNI